MTTWTKNTQLGPYALISPIGTGGMGEVWKARDTRLNRIVAVKRLKEEHRKRFEHEARSIAALNHPHICQLYDVGPDYLVMEYIEGTPPQRPLPADKAIDLAIQIATALEEAHRRGITHRDLKPANILVTANRTAKLLDFGLAKPVTAADSDVTRNTMDGALMDTAASENGIGASTKHARRHSFNSRRKSWPGRRPVGQYRRHQAELPWFSCQSRCLATCPG